MWEILYAGTVVQSARIVHANALELLFRVHVTFTDTLRTFDHIWAIGGPDSCHFPRIRSYLMSIACCGPRYRFLGPIFYFSLLGARFIVFQLRSSGPQ